MSAVTVSALHLYPVKSCRGHAPDSIGLDHRGIVGDRRFLIVDENNRFLTQRDSPRLALVSPVEQQQRLTLAAPGIEPVVVDGAPADAPARDALIWGDTVRTIDLGDVAADWLSKVLQRPARLVGIGPEFSRPMRQAVALDGDEVAFADGHPLLLISEASLDELNERLDLPVPMNRFRPNVVLRGAPPFAEDHWRRVRIGGVILRASGPCGRCVITTTDQETLARAREPLHTLATYRRDARGEVNFGQNYIHETKSGNISVGAVVEILS